MHDDIRKYGRPFPVRPGLTAHPNRHSRLQMGARLCVSPDFIARRNDIAHDADGDALVVRGEACDHEDCFFAIPADPLGRQAPEVEGEASVSVWHVSGSPYRDAPAVIGLDLETASAGERSGCPTSMLCVPASFLGNCMPAEWSSRLQYGAACSILERHHGAKALILASDPCNSADPALLAILAAELRALGYAGPILELPGVNLRAFVFGSLHRWNRIAAFVGELRFLAAPVPVALGALLPTPLPSSRSSMRQ